VIIVPLLELPVDELLDVLDALPPVPPVPPPELVELDELPPAPLPGETLPLHPTAIAAARASAANLRMVPPRTARQRRMLPDVNRDGGAPSRSTTAMMGGDLDHGLHQGARRKGMHDG
jgi:hypothetical protein